MCTSVLLLLTNFTIVFCQWLHIQDNNLIRQYFPDLYKRKSVEGKETS